MYGTYGKDVEKDYKSTDLVLSTKMEPLLNPDGSIRSYFGNYVKTDSVLMEDTKWLGGKIASIF